MNYFQFYDIPVSFFLDEADLKRRFLQNSKMFHPDHFTLESEEKQTEVLEQSALNNQAYRTLADFDLRMAYILQLTGTLEGEGKNEIPQAFLLEMMDLNEALMELEFDPDEKVLSDAAAKVDALEAGILQAVTPVLKTFEFENSTAEQLAKVKEFYLKKRYLWRIRQNLNRFAAASKEAPQD